MKSVVHFRQDAETDVADTAAWYENQSAGLGAEFLDEILATCNSIAENPQMYPNSTPRRPESGHTQVSIWTLLSSRKQLGNNCRSNARKS